MPKLRGQPGDIIEIPLSTGKFAYAHLIGRFDQGLLVGPLIRVLAPVRLDRITDVSELDIDDVLFGPVFVAVGPPIRANRWRVVGNRPIRPFELPCFKEIQEFSPGKKHEWNIIKPSGVRKFVGALPKWAAELEFPFVFDAVLLEKRIETGRYLGDQTY